MKRSSVLFNTARGEVVDEPALVVALTGGTIAAAGLDVLAPEPPVAANSLRTPPDVIVSPHVGGVTGEARAVGDDLPQRRGTDRGTRGRRPPSRAAGLTAETSDEARLRQTSRECHPAEGDAPPPEFYGDRRATGRQGGA
jgi:hypothetical protein